ncbi:PAS domain S-box protein [Magnetospirillum sp. SS-4]|uniref:sensor histidine kinase n=1 Tax=Magnetospirillum sp. SS-4 TaxID=2681465 RepID=UPI00137FABD5|nr:PAS domain S-box protein [Magnetospirillum sp. SS-4]CAA7612682.1 C4-dicarboxylate transport sensor protein DctS [Magnetospirillum sp. SS-4]
MTSFSPLRSRDAIQVMPLLAMGMVVMLLGVLLWLLHRNEVEDETRSLIQDVLWVEQNLHFNLTSNAEKLRHLADLLGREGLESGAFPLQAGTMIANAPEIERIIVRDAGGTVLRTSPPAEGQDGGVDPVWHDTFTLARTIGHPVYGPPFLLDGRGSVFETHVPIFVSGRFAGTVAGIFSLDDMLTHHVPWWFTQTYRLEVIDGNGTVLAAKAQVPTTGGGLSYQVRFEPPGQGLQLLATVHRVNPHLARNVLAAAILALALSAVWSLWALRRHVMRRQQAEQALRTEHAFRKAMEDSLTVGMRARDLQGRITYVNPAFCRMVGWSADELVGAMPPMPYWVPEDIERTLALHQAVLRGDAPPDGFEIVFRRKDGERFHALIYEAPLIDSDGRHTGWMASVLDITERKHSEEMARQQQDKLQRTARLITMGEMASTLAHELNQPLSAIASYATGCLNRLAAGDVDAAELTPPIAKLGEQARRAGKIIRRIHDFVRKSEPAAVNCALNDVVEGAVGFLEAEARKRCIHVDLDLDNPSPRVMADRILIEQVVLNLTRNAMEAMGQSPRPERILSVRVSAEDGQALVRIADTGCGIPPEVADSLFTPFFSTKEDGMGMGLNICRSIIESHRGRLWFEPNPDGGSAFLFTLPEKRP